MAAAAGFFGGRSSLADEGPPEVTTIRLRQCESARGQLEAAGVHPRKRNNGQAGIQAGHDGSGVREAEIEFAESHTLRSKLCWDVADIGEALKGDQNPLFNPIAPSSCTARLRSPVENTSSIYSTF